MYFEVQQTDLTQLALLVFRHVLSNSLTLKTKTYRVPHPIAIGNSSLAKARNSVLDYTATVYPENDQVVLQRYTEETTRVPAGSIHQDCVWLSSSELEVQIKAETNKEQANMKYIIQCRDTIIR